MAYGPPGNMPMYTPPDLGMVVQSERALTDYKYNELREHADRRMDVLEQSLVEQQAKKADVSKRLAQTKSAMMERHQEIELRFAQELATLERLMEALGLSD